MGLIWQAGWIGSRVCSVSGLKCFIGKWNMFCSFLSLYTKFFQRTRWIGFWQCNCSSWKVRQHTLLAQGPCNQNIKLAIKIADDGRLIKQTGWPRKGVDCSYNQNKYQPLKNHKSDNQEIKVQVKRTFKSCSFLSTNEQKNRLCKKFSSTPNTSVQQVPKHSTSK